MTTFQPTAILVSDTRLKISKNQHPLFALPSLAVYILDEHLFKERPSPRVKLLHDGPDCCRPHVPILLTPQLDLFFHKKILFLRRGRKRVISEPFAAFFFFTFFGVAITLLHTFFPHVYSYLLPVAILPLFKN